VVHVVGGIKRRRAREKQVIVDLQRMMLHVVALRREFGAINHESTKRGHGRTRGERFHREHTHALRARGACLRTCMQPGLTHGGKIVVLSSETVTVFELVGGQQFFDALVDRFYAHVERNAELRSLYPEDLEPGKRALALFLGQYWGGPPIYSAEKGHPRLRMRHAPFAIDERARNAWLTAMLAAVDETDSPDVARRMFHEYFESASTAMINRAGGATMDT
jgi:hemoglobin